MQYREWTQGSQSIDVTRRRTQWLAWVFVGLGVAAAIALGAMVTGRLRVDGEWPGLIAGMTLLLLLFLLRGR